MKIIMFLLGLVSGFCLSTAISNHLKIQEMKAKIEFDQKIIDLTLFGLKNKLEELREPKDTIWTLDTIGKN